MYAILRVPHRVSCACHAMPCVPSTLPRTTFAIAAPADAQKHETTLILLDQKSIKDIRFTVSKEFWRGYPFYNTLPARVMGTFEQWGLTSKLIPYITWDDGQRDTALSMCDLLAADFQFELYADGRSKPKANARRLLAGGAGIGTAAAEDDEAVADGDQPSTISVPYQVGRAEHTQVWTKRAPEGIREDVRGTDRVRATIKGRSLSEYNTPFKMFANVALPKPFMQKMWGEDGYINQRLDGQGNNFDHRKTSVSEGVKFYCYMLAIANNPGRPIRAMFNESNDKGEKVTTPAPAYGRFGMGEHRFLHLMKLAAFMYDVEQADLDHADPWRFCNLAIECHNQHWNDIYEPSWLIVLDELMCPDTRKEGDKETDIPFTSSVPRKPKDIGAEVKCTADGESGPIIRCELALKYKRRAGQARVTEPYRAEWGATSAQCLRLTEPWHRTGRAVGGDAHFTSVDSLEAMSEHVSAALTPTMPVLTSLPAWQGLYGFGDCKTITDRFPADELKAMVGPESGDWAVISSTMANGKLIYGLGHRRGPAVEFM